MKNPFYTLNIARITKPQKFSVKYILIRHEEKKNLKILCNHGVLFAQILRKKHQNLCRQSRTFNDEPQIFFLMKVVIDAIKMSMTFLFFAFFLHEYSPAKSPPNHKDYPPTIKICDPSLIYIRMAV